jgi:predicted ABC-type transport system involved in lysophospholipase L1 biosynthesis ATPase subunit
MPADDVVLALREVSKDYHGLRPLRLRHLDVRRGESVALIGFDRVGAELLTSLVTGAVLPDAGDVQAFGGLTREVTSADQWLDALSQFGILSERVMLLGSCSVEQNLVLPYTIEIDEIPADARRKARALADEVGLGEALLDLPAEALGAHDAQRLRLAKALALGPRVLIAEHPNAPLSVAEAQRFASDLSAIAVARNLTMIVTTADHTFAEAVASRVLRVRPVTGELTQVRGWRDWFRRG